MNQVRWHTSAGVCAQRETKRISTTLRNTLREVLLLASLRLGNLALVKVTLLQLLVQRLELESLDNVDRVDNVSEGLAHLATVCITDHCVAVDLLEWHLTREVDTEENHTSNPEEQDIPACLEERRWVELVKVKSLGR